MTVVVVVEVKVVRTSIVCVALTVVGGLVATRITSPDSNVVSWLVSWVTVMVTVLCGTIVVEV